MDDSRDKAETQEYILRDINKDIEIFLIKWLRMINLARADGQSGRDMRGALSQLGLEWDTLKEKEFAAMDKLRGERGRLQYGAVRI